jgi:DNA-binding transcriptional ArsR family regulator
MQVTYTMNERAFSKYFKAFGDPSRLRILMLLSSNEKTVNQIVKSIGLSQPTVSRHLAILREAGIVTSRRERQNVYYGLKKEAVAICCVGFCDCLDIPRSVIKIKVGKKNL